MDTLQIEQSKAFNHFKMLIETMPPEALNSLLEALTIDETTTLPPALAQAFRRLKIANLAMVKSRSYEK
jgi:hypothetical protein